MILRENHFDVVIAGAGISGLLLASELSKSLSVLVIESKDQQEVNKFWVTLKSCVDLNPNLKNYVDLYFNHMEFSDAYRNIYKLEGQYVLWDADELTNYLISEILVNNGKLQFSQRFCGYKIEKGRINIFANDLCYSAKLFIDCMGYNSPLVLAKDMISIEGYYLLHGAKLKLKKPIDPICLSNVILSKKPSYFEVFPNSKGEAYATMIYPTSGIRDMDRLVADFEYLINKSIFSKFFEPSNSLSKLSGIVPVGTIKRRALERIFFFGESAQSNPAATGTCLTRLLLNYHAISDFLIQKVNEDDLSEQTLSKSPIVLNPFIRKLQMKVFQVMLSSNSDRYSRYISFFDKVDNELINKFIFGDMTMNDILNKRNILGFAKKENFMLLKPLLGSLFNVT